MLKSCVTLVIHNILVSRALMGTCKPPCAANTWKSQLKFSAVNTTVLWYVLQWLLICWCLTTDVLQLQTFGGLARAVCYVANVKFHTSLFETRIVCRPVIPLYAHQHFDHGPGFMHTVLFISGTYTKRITYTKHTSNNECLQVQQELLGMFAKVARDAVQQNKGFAYKIHKSSTFVGLMMCCHLKKCSLLMNTICDEYLRNGHRVTCVVNILVFI